MIDAICLLELFQQICQDVTMRRFFKNVFSDFFLFIQNNFYISHYIIIQLYRMIVYLIYVKYILFKGLYLYYHLMYTLLILLNFYLYSVLFHVSRHFLLNGRFFYYFWITIVIYLVVLFFYSLIFDSITKTCIF